MGIAGYYGYEFDGAMMNILDHDGYTICTAPMEMGFELLINANAQTTDLDAFASRHNIQSIRF